MKYSSGPQVLTMPKDGSDLVEVRSRAGAARQFSPSAARNCGPIREVLIRVLPKKGIALEIGSCPFRKLYPAVLVVQSSQDRNGEDGARTLDCSMQGRIFL
jgi:hypothetical protein